MGKGKGSFDYWATRVAVNQVVLELKGLVHEQIVRDAFRLAGNKLPGSTPPMTHATWGLKLTVFLGQWEFVKKGDPPMVGLTKLEGVTLEELKKPWLKAAREATSQPTESTEKSSASSPTP